MLPLLVSVHCKKNRQISRLGASWKDYLVYLFASGRVISTSYSSKGCQTCVVSPTLTLTCRFYVYRSILVSQGCHDRVPQTEGLNNRNLLSHGSGSLLWKVKVSGGLVPFDSCEEGLCSGPLSLACRQRSSPCISLYHCPPTPTPQKCLCVQISLYKNTCRIGLWTTVMT